MLESCNVVKLALLRCNAWAYEELSKGISEISAHCGPVLSSPTGSTKRRKSGSKKKGKRRRSTKKKKKKGQKGIGRETRDEAESDAGAVRAVDGVSAVSGEDGEGGVGASEQDSRCSAHTHVLMASGKVEARRTLRTLQHFAHDTHSSQTTPAAFLSGGLTLADTLTSVVHGIVHDCMLWPVKQTLKDMATWNDIWDQGTSTFQMLASFSTQPSEYMTQVGEQLLTILQQLEPFVLQEPQEPQTPQNSQDVDQAEVEEDGTDKIESKDAMFWLRMLAKSVEKIIQSQTQQIPRLSDRGGKQLACDIEYFGTVLTALGVEPNPLLVALGSVATASLAEVKALAQDGRLAWVSDRQRLVLQTIVDIRQLDFKL